MDRRQADRGVAAHREAADDRAAAGALVDECSGVADVLHDAVLGSVGGIAVAAGGEGEDVVAIADGAGEAIPAPGFHGDAMEEDERRRGGIAVCAVVEAEAVDVGIAIDGGHGRPSACERFGVGG